MQWVRLPTNLQGWKRARKIHFDYLRRWGGFTLGVEILRYNKGIRANVRLQRRCMVGLYYISVGESSWEEDKDGGDGQ